MRSVGGTTSIRPILEDVAQKGPVEAPMSIVEPAGEALILNEGSVARTTSPRPALKGRISNNLKMH